MCELNVVARADRWYAGIQDPVKFKLAIIRGDWASSTPAWCEMDCRISILPTAEVRNTMAAVEPCIEQICGGDNFQVDGFVQEPESRLRPCWPRPCSGVRCGDGRAHHHCS
jgi:acetylornithine deacetylase